MISKDTFIEVVNGIIEDYEHGVKTSNLINKLFHGTTEPDDFVNNDLQVKMEHALLEGMNVDDEAFYDLDEAINSTIEEDGPAIDFGYLYDELVREYGCQN